MGMVTELRRREMPKKRVLIITNAMYFKDLEGRRPSFHPEIKRDENGEVLFEPKLVLVQHDFELLWFIDRLGPKRLPRTIRRVHLRLYPDGNFTYVQYEHEVRLQMRAWDDHVLFVREVGDIIAERRAQEVVKSFQGTAPAPGIVIPLKR